MELTQIIPHVEALVFATEKPLSSREILDYLNNAMAFLEDRASLDQVEAALQAISEKYASEFYSFEIRQSGGGYQFLTKAAYYPTVSQLNGDKYLKKLSTAALETLAIIAYKQPVSKSDIEWIRGVNSDYSIQKLLEKDLIAITGRKDDQPGRPLMYSTSAAFMDYFGLNGPEDLPRISEVFPEDLVEATLVGRALQEQARREADAGLLEVSVEGELQLRLQSENPTPDADVPDTEDPSGDEDAASDTRES